MSEEEEDKDPNYPGLGDIVHFFNEDKRPFVAIVCFVHHDRIDSGTGRPVCNLAIFKHDGRNRAQVEVEPAYDDGDKWRLIEKWAWPGEVPKDQYNHGEPDPKMRIRKVGQGEHLVP